MEEQKLYEIYTNGLIIDLNNETNDIKESEYRYTKDHPYIGRGLSRETKEGKEYSDYEADVAEFNDKFMGKNYFTESKCIKMGLGIDEVLESSINFSRKNYACYFPNKPYPEDVKLVGNSIKSKKMPIYIETFLDTAIRQLLRGEGQKFIDYYYEYLSKIYNYQIPLRDIASKGKIKKSVNEYIQDTKTLTKAGRPKSRQAWYELVIANDIPVNNGDTIYYINTGKSKSHSDVKKITHYYFNSLDGEKVEFTKDIDKGYKKYKKDNSNLSKDQLLEKQDWIGKEWPNFYTEEEVIMNCVLVPNEIVDAEDDIYCNDENGIEYNVAKYIEMFNKRITPLLVCFSKEIRYDILVNNPDDRKWFTEEQCKLSSGDPNKPSDQDTYEQLMTMEDKEIAFWTKYDMVPPFIEECGMGKWEDIVKDYHERKDREKQLGIDKVRELYESVIRRLTSDEMESFMEDGELPAALSKVIDVDPVSGDFVSKEYPDIVIGTVNDLIEVIENKAIESENGFEELMDQNIEAV